MKVIRTVMIYSLKDYLGSLRLFLSFIIVVLLMAFGALVYSQQYQQELMDYRGNRTEQDRRIQEESRSLASVVMKDRYAFKRPSPLQFIVDGGEASLPNKVPFNVNVVMSPEREAYINYMIPPFEGIDWDFIVRVIFSFIAIALTYDAVSGERERGTLRLIMANPVPRDKYIIGKFLAAFFALATPLLFGGLISVAIVVVYGHISLSSQDLLRGTMHMLLSLFYIALFVLIGLLVSIRAKKSSASLVVLLLIWVCLVIAIPGVARPVAIIHRDISRRDVFNRQVSEILDDTIKEYEGQDVSHAPLDVAPIDDSEYRWAEMMDKVDAREQEMVDNYWAAKLEQSRLARSISMVSPAGLYRFAGQDLLNTGIARQEEYVRSVKAFRGVLADFGREMDALDKDSPHILFREWYMSQKPVDPDIVPRYGEKDSGDWGGFESGLRGMMVLISEVLVLFIAAHVSFLRSDVR